MKYRICPVCDQKMKSAHYCSNCRAWVKEPWVREVDYYLNERHPAREADCSYHGSVSPKTSMPDRPRTGQASQPQLQNQNKASSQPQPARYAAAAGKTPAQKGTYTHVAGGSYGAPVIPKAQDPFKRWTTVAVAAIICISILVRVCGAMVKALDLGRGTREPEAYAEEYLDRQETEAEEVYGDVDLGAYEADEYWYEYEELTDQEVLAAGTACNGMNHFVITGEETEELLRVAMELYGYEFTKVERKTENGRNGDYCWYESSTVLDLRPEEEYAEPYIEINCDTVTGALHWVDIDLESREHVIEFVRLVLTAMEEKQQLDPEGDIVALYDAELVPLIEKTESFDYILGDVEVYGVQYSDVYSVTVLPSSWAEGAQ